MSLSLLNSPLQPALSFGKVELKHVPNAQCTETYQLLLTDEDRNSPEARFLNAQDVYETGQSVKKEPPTQKISFYFSSTPYNRPTAQQPDLFPLHSISSVHYLGDGSPEIPRVPLNAKYGPVQEAFFKLFLKAQEPATKPLWDKLAANLKGLWQVKLQEAETEMAFVTRCLGTAVESRPVAKKRHVTAQGRLETAQKINRILENVPM